MNHVLYGASLIFMMGVMMFIAKRGRVGLPFLILLPIAMGILAFWAVIPDIPRMLYMHDLYMRIHADPRINIFLWHGYVDSHWDAYEESSLNAMGIAIEAALLMTVALRQLFREERR